MEEPETHGRAMPRKAGELTDHMSGCQGLVDDVVTAGESCDGIDLEVWNRLQDRTVDLTDRELAAER